MTSPYNTRSRSASSGGASSISVTSPKTVASKATSTTTEHRHFCIVLTNNPRMIESATRNLRNVILNNVSAVNEQGRRREQQQQQQNQMQYLTVPTTTQTRSTRRQHVDVPHIEQQVPLSTQPLIATAQTTNMRAYEKEIEQDFQAQIEPMLRMYLQKTRRSYPINSVFYMSNCTDI